MFGLAREARLRTEFADRHPELEAGNWYPADWVCEAVIPEEMVAEQRLPATEFDFRGGIRRGGQARLRTRATDPEMVTAS